MADSPALIEGIYETKDLALMRDAIAAVCAELGIAEDESEGREAVALRVMHSWTAGGRMPLNLVSAGLNGPAASRAAATAA